MIILINMVFFRIKNPQTRLGETFVPQKVTMAVTRISLGLQDKLRLGNLMTKCDLDYAPEYCEDMLRMF